MPATAMPIVFWLLLFGFSAPGVVTVTGVVTGVVTGAVTGSFFSTAAGASSSAVTMTVSLPFGPARLTTFSNGFLFGAVATTVCEPGSTGTGTPHCAEPTT